MSPTGNSGRSRRGAKSNSTELPVFPFSPDLELHGVDARVAADVESELVDTRSKALRLEVEATSSDAFITRKVARRYVSQHDHINCSHMGRIGVGNSSAGPADRI